MVEIESLNLIHYYRRGTPPFRSLSSLPEDQALQLMHTLYVEGSVIWERFKNPLDYLTARRQTEAWLRQAFIAKGGEPELDFPIYFVLGRSKWIERMADLPTLSTTDEIQVPLSILSVTEISFTYPDSMVSRWLESQKDQPYYQPDYHSKVFTKSEILAILSQKGLPDEGWQTGVPDRLAHYVEAQAWSLKPLENYLQHRIMIPSAL